MIEMHELEQAWNGLDEKLESQGRKLEQIQRRHGIDNARARLRLVSLGLIFQLVMGLLISLWAGGYWYDHLDQIHLVVYGVAIHLYGLGLLITSTLQLVRLAQLDYRAPVLALQQQIVSLRRLRVGSERALLIAGFVLWVPFAFIALRAIGVDVWLTSPDVVLWNLAVGVGLSILVAWLTRRFHAWFERDATGRSLRAAEVELAELSQPERCE